MARTPAPPATASTAAGPGGPEWGRRRLLVILVVAALVAVVLVVALIRAVYVAVADLDDNNSTGETGITLVTRDPDSGGVEHGAAYRDQIAAEPMLSVTEAATLPADPAADTLPRIKIPSGTVPGPAHILSGFPRTPEGAVGQLAQIDVAVLQAMSLPTAREVYQSWALPGGIGADRWQITVSVAAFLSAASMGEVVDAGTWVEAEPAAAVVKGVDGPDWLVACVLLKVTATYRQEAQVAFGHCERMQWTGGRWMIAPGLPPAPAPSTWPATDLANKAGWRPWATTVPETH